MAPAARAARPWQAGADALVLTVRLAPKGGRDAIEGLETRDDGRIVLRVKVRAPAVDGAANAALVRLLADALDVSPGAVRLVAGQAGRIKRLRIDGRGTELASILEKIVGAR
jgi:uncharacterized protein